MNTIEIICTVIGAVGVILGGIWFLFDKVFRIGKTSQRISSMEKNLDEMKDAITKLPCGMHHEDITKIKTILVEKYPKSYNVFSIKSSPRHLNDLGEKLYSKINGESFIIENKKVLFDYITNTRPLVALDVEQAANEACRSLLRTPAFNRLKDFVYNEPSWELQDGTKYDISVNDLCFVIGIKLRDKYLAEVGLQASNESQNVPQ